MALLKEFKKKIENSNMHMSQGITQHSKKLQTIIKVLDLQQELQKDPTSALGFEKYSAIKEIYKQQQEDLKVANRKNKRADAILAGEGTTTLAPSHTELVSEDDKGATTSEFANSELLQ